MNNQSAKKLCEVNVRINGESYSKLVSPRLLLSDFIRDEIGLTGTHVGCEHGVCGACTVLVDGVSLRSCLTFAVQVTGKSVTTIEGLGNKDNLSILQDSFSEKHGLQCGFCTPGMLITAKELLDKNIAPSREEIREAISGNICRCTGYQQIIDSIEYASKRLTGKEG